MAAQVLPEICKLTDRPIRYIAVTHLHSDHTGGARSLFRATGGSAMKRTWWSVATW
jgi:glyoxylase-like metal-dependent hydrolase (beta-lactamase superfamily II)